MITIQINLLRCKIINAILPFITNKIHTFKPFYPKYKFKCGIMFAHKYNEPTIHYVCDLMKHIKFIRKCSRYWTTNLMPKHSFVFFKHTISVRTQYIFGNGLVINLLASNLIVLHSTT